MKKMMLALVAIVAGLSFAGNAFAQTSSPLTGQSIDVTAEVTAACITYSAGSMPFGTINGTVDEFATATISVTCNDETVFDISIGKGAGTNTQRTMARLIAGTSLAPADLDYQLYHTAVASGNGWGFNDGTVDRFGGPKSETGTGVSVDYTVHGEILKDQGVPAGDYSDAVTVTISW